MKKPTPMKPTMTVELTKQEFLAIQDACTCHAEWLEDVSAIAKRHGERSSAYKDVAKLKALEPKFAKFIPNILVGALVPVLLALITQCAQGKAQAGGFYDMDCGTVAGLDAGKRCENTEAICYQSAVGFSCIKKDSP